MGDEHDSDDEGGAPPPPKPPSEVTEVVFVQVQKGDSSMRHVNELIFEYTEFLANKGCDVGSFQDLDRELAELPGRYAPEQGGCLLVAYRAGSPYLEEVKAVGTAKLGKAVAGGEEGALGCCGLKALPCGAAEIKRLYVRGKVRGGGLGKALAAAVLAQAQAANRYKEVKLDTLERLEGVSELYHALGFRPCPPYVPNPMPDAVFMHRSLPL